jgi:glucose/arabinose dehydrogenase
MRLRPWLLLVLVACSGSAEVSVNTSVTTVASPSTSLRTTTTSAPSTTPAPATTTTTTPLNGLTYSEVATGLPFPVLVTFRPSDGQTFTITKDGRVWSLTGSRPEVFLDISDRVRNSGEQGLLGAAWHPTEPDRLFLHYSDTSGDTAVSEFVSGVERPIFTSPQPASNHNGGMIAFGADRYLYIALGDGGGGGDTFGTGQPVDDLLGGMLRIDVDSGDPYGIPEDNPYTDGSGAPEVWSSGLRNPWRFWFDQPSEGSELLYIGDVGQSSYEEIDVAAASLPALNYGWPVTEGLHCFNPPRGCDTEGITLPVIEVPHSSGVCSITGGVTYRGVAIPELAGHYFYSDYCAGYLRSFFYSSGVVTDERDWTGQVGYHGGIVSFGVDAVGEVYVMTSDTIYRIDPVR